MAIIDIKVPDIGVDWRDTAEVDGEAVDLDHVG